MQVWAYDCVACMWRWLYLWDRLFSKGYRNSVFIIYQKNIRESRRQLLMEKWVTAPQSVSLEEHSFQLKQFSSVCSCCLCIQSVKLSTVVLNEMLRGSWPFSFRLAGLHWCGTVFVLCSGEKIEHKLSLERRSVVCNVEFGFALS